MTLIAGVLCIQVDIVRSLRVLVTAVSLIVILYFNCRTWTMPIVADVVDYLSICICVVDYLSIFIRVVTFD